MERIITCESVFRGHPDKICDQISDAIVDACLKEDIYSRCGVETAIKDNNIWIFGEITTNAKINYEEIAKRVLKDIGYTEDFNIRVNVVKQSSDIALGVDKEGAGDQGMMYGYADSSSPSNIPLPLYYSHLISKSVEKLRSEEYPHLFAPDGKCQVSIRYVDDKPVEVTKIIVSAQTSEDADPSEVETIIKKLIKQLNIKCDLRNVLVNPTGRFVKGGAYADAGLTGRKIICDSYGGVGRHGGGAFSGKEGTKVDRSGAYYCRYIAKSLVRAGLATKCEVGVAYSIGIAEPVSISVNTFNTGIADDELLLKFVKKHFDFRPANIIEELHLRWIRFEPFAGYGHFGTLVAPWEEVDKKAYELKEAWQKETN